MIANDGPFCPVSSFEKYLSVLNPMNEYLFQRPKSSGEGEIWYDNMVCRREHSRQEDESHLTPSGVVSNIHKSFDSYVNPWLRLVFKSGYANTELTCFQSPKSGRRNRSTDIIWYNPPFSRNVAANVRQSFLKILDEEFPEGPCAA